MSTDIQTTTTGTLIALRLLILPQPLRLLLLQLLLVKTVTMTTIATTATAATSASTLSVVEEVVVVVTVIVAEVVTSANCITNSAMTPTGLTHPQVVQQAAHLQATLLAVLWFPPTMAGLVVMLQPADRGASCRGRPGRLAVVGGAAVVNVVRLGNLPLDDWRTAERRPQAVHHTYTGRR